MHCEIGGTQGPLGYFNALGATRLVHWLILVTTSCLRSHNVRYIMLQSLIIYMHSPSWYKCRALILLVNLTMSDTLHTCLCLSITLTNQVVAWFTSGPRHHLCPLCYMKQFIFVNTRIAIMSIQNINVCPFCMCIRICMYMRVLIHVFICFISTFIMKEIQQYNIFSRPPANVARS